MLCSERFVRNHKRQTDCALHRAYSRLASDPLVFEKFHALLHCARSRAPRLLEAPIVDGRHLGAEALVNLSRFHAAHLRPVANWTGTPSGWRAAVASLARHLVCEYTVPAFLAGSWYAMDSGADTKRGWFVAHSRGASFRSLGLPIAMTRKMEHIFLASPDHLPIETAMRRAELLGLGAAPECVQAVLSTRLGTDLRNAGFWRTVWLFLIANARDVDPARIGPMLDYIQAVRHERITVPTREGTMECGPPQPDFSMKGRTVNSIMRLMRDWHRSLANGRASLAWGRSQFEPWLFEELGPDPSEKPKRWHMVELTDSAQLRTEGAALHHCVASYAERCHRGASSIWSLRFWQGERVHPVLTVEVDPGQRAIIQARGFANRSPSGKSLRLLQNWAVREKLRMPI
jgi:hypothetical protein